MTQRIQTILLFLSAVAFGLLFFMPIATYYGEFNILQFSIFGVTSQIPGGDVPFGKMFTLPILLLTVVITLASLYLSMGIFRAVRVNQLEKTKKALVINEILSVIWMVIVFAFYITKIRQSISVQPTFNIGVFMPLAGLIMMIISLIGLKKDIQKVRSMDRLR
jgi:hypothetical protein